MSDIEVKPVDEVEVVEEVHETNVEEIPDGIPVPAAGIPVPAQMVDEPVEVVAAPVVKGSRGHRPKMSPSKKINVYKKEECPDCKKLLTIGNLRYKHARFCIGKKIKESTPTPAPSQAVVMKAPVITEREIAKRVDAFNVVNRNPRDEESEIDVVRQYISRLKREQEDRRQIQYKTLINSAISRRNKN